MAGKANKKHKTIEIVNRKATHEYQFLVNLEAGMVLHGTEIKAIRKGNVNLRDAFCYFKNGELFMRNMFIAEYDFGNYFNHEPRRLRKLLLKSSELKKLERKIKERGFTIVPYKVYLNERGIAKVEIALAQGKKTFDKRQTLKDKDMKRDTAREKKTYE